MKTKKVTISDIAAALQISPVSISRALAGQPGVGEELKNKILDKAREMGYTKNPKNDFASILVLYQQNPYMDDNNNSMVRGVEKALQNVNADYHVEFVGKEAQAAMALPYKLSKGLRFDGVILIGRFNLDYARLIYREIPNLIFLTGYSPAYDYDNVWFGFCNAGYQLGEYLIKRGHTRIGFAGDCRLFRNKERLIGITAALEDYHLPLCPEFCYDLGAGYHGQLQEQIKQKRLPTAIICDHDITALELIKLLYENQLKVPDDISIVGSGNSEMSTLSIPALTTMDLNIEYSSEVTVATLLRRIGRPDKPSESIAILSRLVERDSVRSLAKAGETRV